MLGRIRRGSALDHVVTLKLSACDVGGKPQPGNEERNSHLKLQRNDLRTKRVENVAWSGGREGVQMTISQINRDQPHRCPNLSPLGNRASGPSSPSLARLESCRSCFSKISVIHRAWEGQDRSEFRRIRHNNTTLFSRSLTVKGQWVSRVWSTSRDQPDECVFSLQRQTEMCNGGVETARDTSADSLDFLETARSRRADIRLERGGKGLLLITYCHIAALWSLPGRRSGFSLLSDQPRIAW